MSVRSSQPHSRPLAFLFQPINAHFRLNENRALESRADYKLPKSQSKSMWSVTSRDNGAL